MVCVCVCVVRALAARTLCASTVRERRAASWSVLLNGPYDGRKSESGLKEIAQ